MHIFASSLGLKLIWISPWALWKSFKCTSYLTEHTMYEKGKKEVKQKKKYAGACVYNLGCDQGHENYKRIN